MVPDMQGRSGYRMGVQSLRLRLEAVGLSVVGAAARQVHEADSARGRMIRGFFYRQLMRLAHRYHWHYAPPCYPDGDTMLWCHWCGLRQVIKRRGDGRSRYATVKWTKG